MNPRKMNKIYFVLFTHVIFSQQLQPSITCSKLTTRCEICSKLTKRHQNDAIGVALVSLLLTLNIFHTLFSSIFIVNFEQVNASWDCAHPPAVLARDTGTVTFTSQLV